MIFIIGINHTLQWKKKNSDSKRFIKFIQKIIIEYKIEVIAEEFSKEALKLNGVSSTVLKDLSIANKINHLYCDPSSRIRDKLGIKSTQQIKRDLNFPDFIPSTKTSYYEKIYDKERSKYFQIREAYWLSKIKHLTSKRLLFVCGSKHVDGFYSLLSREGYSSDIIMNNFPY